MAAPPDAGVFVALRVRGDFDPSEVSQVLGVEPTSQVRIGDSAGSRTHDQAKWRLESTKEVEADTIEPHLQWLLDLLERFAEGLREIRTSGATVDVDCFWASVGRSGGPWISPESMARLGALGLPLVISFYAVEDMS